MIPTGWSETPDTSDAKRKMINAARTIIAKAQREGVAPAVKPGGLDFGWMGGGLAIDLANTDPMLLEVPFHSRIVWVHVWALDGAGAPSAVSATIDVQLTNNASFGTMAPLFGTGAIPTLASASQANVDLTDWVLNLSIGDVVIARPTAFSGSAHLLALTIQLRPTDVPLRSDVTDDGDMLTDDNGNLITMT